MSYATLGGANWFDNAQLPDFLWMREGNIPFLYNDGAGNATIGIGLNLRGNSDNMALVLNQMVYGGQNVFAAAATQGFSATTVVAQFESIVSAVPLMGSADGGLNPTEWDPLAQNLSTLQLERALNTQLASYFGVSYTTLQDSSTSVSFTNFPLSDGGATLSQLLQGVGANTIGNYPAIVGYGDRASIYFTSLYSTSNIYGNKHGITVPTANLPPPDSGAWEALVSLYFNGSNTIGPALLNALADNDKAQAWYEIRYGTNLAQSGGVSQRRYDESQLFGLSATSTTDAIQAYEMLAEHRSTILSYETKFGTAPNSTSNPTIPQGQIAAAIQQVNVFNGSNFENSHGNPTLAAPVLPLPTEVGAFIPNAEILLAALNTLLSSVTGGIGDLYDTTTGAIAGTFMVSPTDILVAADATDITDGFATIANDVVRPTDSMTAKHVILGADNVSATNANAVSLIGGAGNDILIAGAGQEYLAAGSGSDTLIAGQALGTLSGAAGNDTLRGYEGNDTFDFAITTGGTLVETILAYPGQEGIVEASNGNTAPTVLGGSATSQIHATGTLDSWSDQYGGQYNFSPNAPGTSLGDLTITGGSALGGNEIVIDNFNISAAESATGFMGIFLQGHIDPPPQPPFIEGSRQSYTLSVDAPSNTAQTFTVTLSGALSSDFEATVGDSIEQLSASGTFSVALPAGESSVSFGLLDVTADNGSSDIASGATLQVGSAIANPDSLGASIESTPLVIDYVSAPSDAGSAPNPTDTITGTYNSMTSITTFYGDGGNDYIAASSPNDYIQATNSVNDSIIGGSGSNSIYGGSGDDVINLSGTQDYVSLGGGYNTVNGGAGKDSITCGNGIAGAPGDDLIIGNGGTDIVLGGTGTDQLYAGTQVGIQTALGNLTATGATGQQGDLLSVLDGSNTVVGGGGNDLITAGTGNDVVFMGPGNDVFEGGVELTAASSNWSVTIAPPTGSAGYQLTLNNVTSHVEGYTNPFSEPYNGTYSNGAELGAGNDTVFLGTGNDFVALGNGSNYVRAGTGSDTVLGGMGDDTIFAGTGTDLIRGGGGNTYIYGGSGADSIYGGDGNNTIIGGSGNATLISANSPGNESLEQNYVTGGSGNDVIYGSGGQDTLIGGTGNVTIYGQSGSENIVGGSGNDVLAGGSGNDTISAGGSGQDSLYANGSSSSTSYLYGGDGDDLIVGGSGSNLLYAGDGGIAGAVTSVYGSTDSTANTTIYGGLGVDNLQGGTGNSIVYGGDGGTATAPTTVLASTGSTTLYGGLGTDILQGGSGTDVLYAGDGGTGAAPTTVYSGSGASTLFGGAGSSLLEDTSSGQDMLVSTTGNDSMVGIGSDTLVAGTGNDVFQSDGGSVTAELTSGFGNVSVQSAGGVYNLNFGSTMASSDFSVTPIFDTSGQFDLVFSGDGGNVTAYGGLDGELGTVSFADTQFSSTTQLLQDFVGGDETLSSGGIYPVVISVENGEDFTSQYNETLAAVGNNDTITGGQSSPTYVSGNDDSLYGNAYGGVTYDSGNYDTINTAANVTVTGSNDDVTGGSIVSGSGADDTLISQGEYTTIVVGNSSDSVSAYGTTDTIQASVSFSLGTYSNINVLELTGSANLVGTDNGNGDQLSANSGNDTLVSTSGVDTFIGGSGNDTFVITNASDVIESASSASSNVIETSVSYTAPTNVNTLMLTGASNLTATANAGNDTLMAAGTGLATLIGGAGSDTFVVDNSSDVIQSASSASSNTVQSSVSYTAPTNVNTIMLTGTGSIVATANSGNDTLIAGGTGPETLVGGAGNDTFILNSASDVVMDSHATSNVIDSSVSYTLPTDVNTLLLTGTANITGTGNAAGDVMTAGAGADTLIAGSAASTLIGGSGNDTFLVNNTSDVVQDTSTTTSNAIQSSVSFTAPTNVNSLTLTGAGTIAATANAGNDTLAATGSGAETLYGGAGNDTFIITTTSDVVADTYATTTNVVDASVNFTLPTNVNTLVLTGAGNLTATGNSAADSIVGNSGNDSLIAGSGADTLVAGTGADTLIGGSGNDVFVLNSASDVVQVAAGHQDTILSSVAYTLPSNVSVLALTGTANITASASSGTVTLIAGAGADTLHGGTGTNTFVVNSATDVVQASSSATFNTVDASFNDTTPANVNELVLTASGLVGTANSANNVLYAAANDTLQAGAGVDTLYAAGNDLLILNSVSDVALEEGGNPANDTLQSSVSYSAPANFNILALTGTGNLTASSNAGNDTLVSNSGVDSLIGGAGNDTFVVNNASDVIESASSATSNTIQSSVSYTAPTNINTLMLTGTANLTGAANAGADTLVANAGVDTLKGGAGNDTFVVDNSADVVQDTVTTTHNVISSSVSYSLSTNVNSLVLTGYSNVTGTGNAANDSLQANSGNDTLVAGSGVDTLIGGGGSDTFILNNSGDVVEHAAPATSNIIETSVSYTAPTNVNTLMLTGASNLTATANAGNDTLIAAGTGLATLIGGAGSDTFVVDNSSDVIQSASSASSNTVQSSVSYTAPTNVNTIMLTGTGSIVATANSGNDTLIAGGTGPETLVGGAGNDTFILNSASDVVMDSHATSNVVESAVSYTLPTDVNTLLLTGTANIAGTGNAAGDVMTAGAGVDTLIAGSAASTLIGGTGNDTFLVNNTSDVVQDTYTTTSNAIQSSVTYSAPTNINSLTLTGAGAIVATANAGNDTLSATGTAAETLVGGSGNDTFIVTNAADVVSDLSGTTAANVLYSSISYTLPTNVNTLILTGSANLTARGNSTNDLIVGNSGNDTLYAGFGIDTLTSGSGNSLFVINNTSDVVSNAYYSNSDSLQSAVSYSLPSGVDSGSVTTVLLTLTGNTDASNVLTAAAEDTVYAEAAANTIYGAAAGYGDAIYVGPYSNVVYTGNGGNSSQVTAVYGSGPGTSILTQNTIYGGTGLNVIYGSPGTDVIYAGTGTEFVQAGTGIASLYGAAGSELLDSQGGFDLLSAGSGNETMDGTGSDTLVAGSGTDQIYEYGAGSSTVVLGSGFGTILADDTTSDGGSYNLEYASGFSASTTDISVGWDSVNNDYALILADGTSTVSVDGGLNPGVINSVSFGGGSPLTLGQLLADASVTAGTVTHGTSTLQFSVANNASLTGSTGSDTISAWGSNDTLTAGSGTENLYAEGSDASVTAGSGTDNLLAYGSADTLNGSASANRTTFTVTNPNDVVTQPSDPGAQFTLYTSVSYTLPTNINVLDVTGTASVVATGNAGNDSITGNSGADTLNAGSGNSTVHAGYGNQLLQGGSGSDVLQAGAGADTLSSGSGVTTLVAGAGVDTLIVNNTSDSLGGTFVAGDTVESSTSISLPNGLFNLLYFTGTANIIGSGNNLADSIVANSGNDQIFVTNSSTIVGGAGADSLFATAGQNNVLIAGTGNDYFDTDPTLNQINLGSSPGNDSLSAFFTEASDVSYTLPALLNTVSAGDDGGSIVDTVIGNSGNDYMTDGGNIVLVAGSGSDTLSSSIFMDTLIGGAGNDLFILNGNETTVKDSSSTSSNVVQSEYSFTLPTNVNTLILEYGSDIAAGNSGSDSLVAGGAADTLVSGTGVDTLVGAAGGDVFIINNSADVLQSVATSGNTLQSSVTYTLPSSINAITLTGAGNVGATANNNNDTLTSNSGVDTLTGGAGNDTFYVNNALDVVVDTSSTSTNLVSSTASFTLPTNVNELILTGAAALKGSANLGNDTLVANTGADTLVSGTSGADSLVGGSGSEIFIVNSTSDIVHDTSTTANNILETTVNFTLPTDVNTLVITGAGAIAGTGNSHTDSMVAGAGTDTLTAGSGVATMTGGAGNDTFVLTNTLDVVSDTYTTTSNVISSTVGYTLPTNINTLIFTGSGALQGKANAGNDSLTANTGSDTLVAGAGQDTLVAGTTGTDSLVGGTGNDIFVVNNTADKVTDASTTNSNTIESSVTYTLPTNVNTLILTGAGAIAGTGNAVADSIIASTGTDTLAAGSGVATLVGGSGNDTFVVNSASDVIQDTSSTSSNVVSSSVTYTLPTDVNRLILTGTSALAGTANSGNDTLTANTGADTLTSGLTGTDSLVAGTGADLFVVNNAADIVTVGGTHGVDTISSSVSYTASTNVADLILTGTSALTGTGNSIAGTITANSGADTLTAGTGADTLVGSSTGTDIFVVNSASDVVSVGTSGLADTIESSVSYTLPTNVQYLTLTGTSALTATGNSALDLLVGNTGADNLIGGTGIAALEGGRTAGADQIKALSNQAALIAGGGKATLTGGAYKDFYAAGLVSDSITTGATANVVSVNDGDGATTLAPTTSATNVLSLGAGIDTESLEFTKSGNNLVLTDGVAGDSVTFTNWYVGSADQDYTTLQVIEIASPDYNSGGGDSLRNKPIEAFNFTALVSAYIAAGSPSNWLLSNDMASASLTTSASADYGGDLAYYFGLNGNLTGVDLSDVSSVLTNSSYGTGTQTINSFGSISGGGGLHLLVKPPGAQPPITSPTASENEGAPIAPIEVAPSDPFQEIKTVGTAPSAGKSGVTPIAPIEVAPVDPFRELTTVGTATMEGKSGVTPTAPIELEPHEPFPYLPPPATAPHIPSGRLPMPRLPEISGLLSQITPRFGLEDFAVLARGSVEETRTAPSAKVPTAPPPKNYVDPINLAWLTMHGRLDQINERILGGIEGAELDEGSHLTALMGATPHTPLRRNISVLELARGPGRHSAS